MIEPPEEPDDDQQSGGSDPMDPHTMDEAFEAIVAGIRHGEPPPTVPTWPAAEDDGPNDGRSDGLTNNEPSDNGPNHEPNLGSSWAGWEDVTAAEVEPEAAAEDDGEDFVPPPPPPIPRGDAVLRWAWLGAVGAPLLALILALMGWDFGGLVGIALVGAFLAGFATLVSRMRTGPSDQDNPDNGAVL